MLVFTLYAVFHKHIEKTSKMHLKSSDYTDNFKARSLLISARGVGGGGNVQLV